MWAVITGRVVLGFVCAFVARSSLAKPQVGRRLYVVNTQTHGVEIWPLERAMNLTSDYVIFKDPNVVIPKKARVEKKKPQKVKETVYKFSSKTIRGKALNPRVEFRRRYFDLDVGSVPKFDEIIGK